MTSLCIFSCRNVNHAENLLAEVDSLKLKNDSLIKILAEGKSTSNYWYNAEYDGEKFIQSGIPNPAEFIENDLRKKTQLIPLKAVLGGTMHFGKIQLLSSEWLIADFDDGHIQGRAIYTYKLNEKTQVEFKILSSIGTE